MHDVKLYLPKFSFSSEFMLADTLKGMGMPGAFDKSADFTGMYYPDRTPDCCLHISHMVHHTLVAVDEEGTEAAAATGVIMEIVSMPAMMRADRPFIFLIRDRQTGNALFIGRFVDPEAGG